MGIFGWLKVKPLIKALGDKNSDVREAAARALGELGDKRAVEPLIKALGDEEWPVRIGAAYALANLSGPRAVGRLIEVLGDEEWGVRTATAIALKSKPKEGQKTTSDEKAETVYQGTAPLVIRIKCAHCGKQYTIGEDAIVTTPVVPAEGAITEMSHPDAIEPMDWKTLSGSPKQAQLNIIGALIASRKLAKLIGKPWSRRWRCYYCNTVQPYILFSEDWSHTIDEVLERNHNK